MEENSDLSVFSDLFLYTENYFKTRVHLKIPLDILGGL